jgi:hypothetical protein
MRNGQALLSLQTLNSFATGSGTKTRILVAYWITLRAKLIKCTCLGGVTTWNVTNIRNVCSRYNPPTRRRFAEPLKTEKTHNDITITDVSCRSSPEQKIPKTLKGLCSTAPSPPKKLSVLSPRANYTDRMIDHVWGTIGGMGIGRGNRNTWRKPVPLLMCPPHDLTWARTRAAEAELAPWTWALFEKPPVMQLVINFPAFYGSGRFITVSTRVLHWSLSWATSPHLISLRSILTISTHLRLDLPTGLFLSVEEVY